MNAREIIEKEFNEAKKQLVVNYNKKGLRASGKFEKSLDVQIKEDDKSIQAVIKGANHSEFMEIGRRPNRQPSIQAVRGLGRVLEQWVIDKGLQGKVSPYAVAHKIVYQGITVPNKHNKGGVISDTINNNWVQELSRKVMFNKITAFRSDIYKLLKD
jgi:hypothetical protein